MARSASGIDPNSPHRSKKRPGRAGSRARARHVSAAHRPPPDSSSPDSKQAPRSLGALSFQARTWLVLSRQLRRSQRLARVNGPSTSAPSEGWLSFAPLVCARTVRPWPATRAVPGLADSLVLSAPGRGAPQGVQLTQQLIWLRQPRTRRRSHSNWNVWLLGPRQAGGTTKLYGLLPECF